MAQFEIGDKVVVPGSKTGVVKSIWPGDSVGQANPHAPRSLTVQLDQGGGLVGVRFEDAQKES
jgi:hypothetical protein